MVFAKSRLLLFCIHILPLLYLKDILHNDAIQLDWDFRISLINDIVQVNIHFIQILNNIILCF